MSTQVTILGTTYTLPSQGDSPPWGDNLSNLIDALIAVANNSAGPSDIGTTTFTVVNNTSSGTNIVGLAFDPSAVQSAIISYSIYRDTSTTELCETGQIFLSYKPVAGSWDLMQYCGGSSGVTFTITSGGQVQYTSTNLSGTGYTSNMVFSAKAFLQ